MARKSRGKKRGEKKPITMTAAGLISFYQETDAVVKLSPAHVVLLAVAFAISVVALHAVLP